MLILWVGKHSVRTTELDDFQRICKFYSAIHLFTLTLTMVYCLCLGQKNWRLAATQPPIILVENHKVPVFFEMICLIITTETDHTRLHESAR